MFKALGNADSPRSSRGFKLYRERHARTLPTSLRRRLLFSFLLGPCVHSRCEEAEPWASHYAYGNYVEGERRAFTHGSEPISNRCQKLSRRAQEHATDVHGIFSTKSLCVCVCKCVREVFTPSPLFDLEPIQTLGSLLQWLLSVHLVPVPAGCVSHWADWWSPLHGSSERGLRHPICPDDPPFETGKTRGIGEQGVRERETRGKGGHSSLV